MKSINLFLLLLTISFSTLNSQTLEQKVDEYITPLVEGTDFYGSVMFAKNGKVELAKGYVFADLEHEVPNTPKSVYHMGSLNKPITAIGVMLLHQIGKLNIEDNVQKYVPDYRRGG